jgi:hypothetical protein
MITQPQIGCSHTIVSKRVVLFRLEIEKRSYTQSLTGPNAVELAGSGQTQEVFSFMS